MLYDDMYSHDKYVYVSIFDFLSMLEFFGCYVGFFLKTIVERSLTCARTFNVEETNQDREPTTNEKKQAFGNPSNQSPKMKQHK
jgi:hypothetical protein